MRRRVFESPVMRAIARILIIWIMGSTVVLAQIPLAPPDGRQEATIAAALTPPVAVSDAIPVSLLVGRSTVVDVGVPIARISLTTADVADALVTTPSQLLINGKTPGTISMFVWERGGAIRRYEIAVQRDLARLQSQLRELFPGEKVMAHSNGRQIVLSGVASSKEVAARVVDVAAGFVDKREDVVTLLQLPQGPRTNQVLLRVRFAEVSRSALTELGLSLFTGPTGIRNTLGRVTTQQFPAPGFDELEWSKDSFDFGAPVEEAAGKFTFSDFLNFFVLSEKYDLGMLVRLLQTRGLFQSLAEPNLVAESGKEASFLAGGEFPIPIAQGSGANMAFTVQFKEFGVRLNFLPTVTGDRVHLRVRPEVSVLDFSNAVVLSGFRIPALTTRRMETELELRDGQTFAIAGLLNNTMTQTLSKVPGIGDIPILGYLFRSKAARKDQTELVVIITPQILPQDSSGVTDRLPRMQEPYLPALPQDQSIPAPPPAFGGPSSSSGAMNAAPVPAVPSAPPQQTAGGRTDVQAPAARERGEQERRPAQQQQLKESRAAQERRMRDERATRERMQKEQRAEMEQQGREERQRREAEARAQAAASRMAAVRAVEERRQQELDRKRQEQAGREQARRDAEAARQAAEQARKDAEQARRDAEQAKKQAEEQQKREKALAEAEARFRAAQAAYEAERARSRQE